MQILAAVIERFLVEGIGGDAGIPVEAQLAAFRIERADIAGLPGEQVVAQQIAALPHRIAVIGVGRVRHHIEAVSEGDLLPIGIANPPAAPCLTGTAPGAVVLHSSVDVVGDLHIDIDVIKLRQGQILHKTPGLAPVAGDGQAPVVAVDHKIRIVGMDPPGVMVRVHLIPGDQGGKGPAAVFALRDHPEKIVDAVFVGGIDINIRIIERAVADIFLRDFPPFKAAVIGAVEGIFLRLYQSVDNCRIVAGDRQTDPSQLSRRQPVFVGSFFPVFPAVIAEVEPGAGTAGFEEPGPAAVFPHCRDQLVGIGRVHHQVGRAGFVVHKEHFPPGFPAIDGLVDTPLGALPPGRSLRRHIGNRRIDRIEQQAVNIASVLQTEVLPGLAPVEAFIDPVTARLAVAGIALSGTHPDDVRDRLIHRHRPDRRQGLLVKYRFPGDPPAGRLPQSPGGSAGVDDVGIF